MSDIRDEDLVHDDPVDEPAEIDDAVPESPPNDPVEED